MFRIHIVFETNDPWKRIFCRKSGNRHVNTVETSKSGRFVLHGKYELKHVKTCYRFDADKIAMNRAWRRSFLEQYEDDKRRYKEKYGILWRKKLYEDHVRNEPAIYDGGYDRHLKDLNEIIYWGNSFDICAEPLVSLHEHRRFIDRQREVFGDEFEKLAFERGMNPHIADLLVDDAIKTGMWRELPDELQEIYKLRVENPNGEFDNPVCKVMDFVASHSKKYIALAELNNECRGLDELYSNFGSIRVWAYREKLDKQLVDAALDLQYRADPVGFVRMAKLAHVASGMRNKYYSGVRDIGTMPFLRESDVPEGYNFRTVRIIESEMYYGALMRWHEETYEGCRLSFESDPIFYDRRPQSLFVNAARLDSAIMRNKSMRRGYGISVRRAVNMLHSHDECEICGFHGSESNPLGVYPLLHFDLDSGFINLNEYYDYDSKDRPMRRFKSRYDCKLPVHVVCMRCNHICRSEYFNQDDGDRDWVSDIRRRAVDFSNKSDFFDRFSIACPDYDRYFDYICSFVRRKFVLDTYGESDLNIDYVPDKKSRRSRDNRK